MEVTEGRGGSYSQERIAAAVRKGWRRMAEDSHSLPENFYRVHCRYVEYNSNLGDLREAFGQCFGDNSDMGEMCSRNYPANVANGYFPADHTLAGSRCHKTRECDPAFCVVADQDHMADSYYS